VTPRRNQRFRGQRASDFAESGLLGRSELRREADLAQVAQPSGDLPADDQTCLTSRAGTDEALARVEDGDVRGISGSPLSVVRRAT
jgi:hypothetical protein